MMMREQLVELSKRLTAQGKLVEAGWVSLRMMAVPKDAPEVQLDEMRNAFFAGAHHVFSSIMAMLDPGDEPTDADLKRVEQIHQELHQFIEIYKLKHGINIAGSA